MTVSGNTRGRVWRRLVAIVAVAGLIFTAEAAAPANAAPTTVCYVAADRPHDSGHFGGTMNAIGRIVRCVGAPVPDLHLDVQLLKYRDGHWRVVPAKSKVLRPKRSLIRVGRYRVCAPGLYVTRARAFGLGKHSRWFYSGVKFVSCFGSSGGGGGGGGGGGW